MEPFEPDQRALNRSPLDDDTILSGEFWGELRVFLAVAKAKSFNRAAEILNTSQPKVSRQVKRLQDLLGSQLFVSTQNGVRLTPKGRALADAVTRLDHSLFALANDLRGDRNEAHGVVRVSITDGLTTSFIAPALPAFSDEFPRIQLHLKSPANVVSLRENQTDMMIGFSPVESNDVVFRRLGSLHLIPIVAKRYVQRHGVPTRANIDQHQFVHSEFYSARTGLWDPWLNLIAMGEVAHFCDNSVAYAMLVKAGSGIGLLGSYTALEPSAVPLELDVRITVPLYAVALSERLRARPVRVVFDWLCGLFGPENPWFADEFRLRHPPNKFDAGMQMLFNI